MIDAATRMLVAHRPALRTLLAVLAVVLSGACVVGALAILAGAGSFAAHDVAAARFLGLYVAPLFLAAPLWARHRLIGIERRSVRVHVLDVAVTGLAIARFADGSVLPFSGHMLFLTYTAATTRDSASYRWLAALLLVETTVFKLWLWDDPASWALGLGLGLLAAAAAGLPTAARAGNVHRRRRRPGTRDHATRRRMRQREVQDGENVRWVCAQALAGVGGSLDAEAAERLEGDDGRVPVVCTPSGGARTVRLELASGWEERMSDDELVAAIARERDA